MLSSGTQDLKLFALQPLSFPEGVSSPRRDLCRFHLIALRAITSRSAHRAICALSAAAAKGRAHARCHEVLKYQTAERPSPILFYQVHQPSFVFSQRSHSFCQALLVLTAAPHAFSVQYLSCGALWCVLLLDAGYETLTALSLPTALVLVWTIICLAIAVHFQHLLVSSDLSKCLHHASVARSLTSSPAARFVPFAIFVCCASLLIIVAL